MKFLTVVAALGAVSACAQAQGVAQSDQVTTSPTPTTPIPAPAPTAPAPTRTACLPAPTTPTPTCTTCSPVPTKPAPEPVCYRLCPSGQYCENGTDFCRPPKQEGECFNPATGHYQLDCAPGFMCVNNKCAYA